MHSWSDAQPGALGNGNLVAPSSKRGDQGSHKKRLLRCGVILYSACVHTHTHTYICAIQCALRGNSAFCSYLFHGQHSKFNSLLA